MIPRPFSKVLACDTQKKFSCCLFVSLSVNGIIWGLRMPWHLCFFIRVINNILIFFATLKIAAGTLWFLKIRLGTENSSVWSNWSRANQTFFGGQWNLCWTSVFRMLCEKEKWIRLHSKTFSVCLRACAVRGQISTPIIRRERGYASYTQGAENWWCSCWY